MGLLDSVLSAIDSKKRTLKRGVMDMIDNPSDWSNMTASRMRENIYGGPENWDAMKKYLQQQPYDKKLKESAQQSMINNAVNESLGAVTAWHGSPHKFDKFDMSKIGTGEGAQAYGHGLYMAESPDVAKAYAEVLPKNAAFNGMPIYEIDTSSLGRRSTLVNGYTQQGNPGGVGGRASYTPKGLADEYDGPIAAYKDLVKKGLVPRNAPKWIDPVSGNIEVSSQGANMYKVDIPDEAVSRFLDWDKPLSEQAPEVRDVVSKLGISDRDLQFAPETWTLQWDDRLRGYGAAPKIGGLVPLNTSDIELAKDAMKKLADDWYQMRGSGTVQELTEKLGGAESAAKALRSHGIPGIRYLDGGSRSAGQGSSNFVLFDDQLPRILERNGEPTGLQPWAKGEWKGLLDDTPTKR